MSTEKHYVWKQSHNTYMIWTYNLSDQRKETLQDIIVSLMQNFF